MLSKQMMRMVILEGITDSIHVPWKTPSFGSLLRIPFSETRPLSLPLLSPGSSNPWRPGFLQSTRLLQTALDWTCGGCLTKLGPAPSSGTNMGLEVGGCSLRLATLLNGGKINSAARNGLSSPMAKMKYKRAVGRERKQTHISVAD